MEFLQWAGELSESGALMGTSAFLLWKLHENQAPSQGLEDSFFAVEMDANPFYYLLLKVHEHTFFVITWGMNVRCFSRQNFPS